MILLGSRYETAKITRPLDANGLPQQYVIRATPVLSTNYALYVISEGERLDALAYKLYHRSDYYWVIADANPELALVDPIPPGTVIRVPGGRNTN